VDRATFLALAVAGALLNGTLVIALLFVAGLFTNKMVVAELAIAAAGFAYLNCAAFSALRQSLAGALNLLSIACCLVAGFLLLR